MIQGNFIGTDVNGTGNLGNGNFGVELTCADNNTIGGTSGRRQRHRVQRQGHQWSNGDGVHIYGPSTGISILGNSIFSNARLGIDLVGGTENAFGVTVNDPCDVRYWREQSAELSGAHVGDQRWWQTTITGTLNSIANTTYRIEFFANSAVDSTGFGEGQTFVGFTNVTTGADGNIAFDVNFPATTTIRHVTATATDPNGNTSEFSAAIGQLLNISSRLSVQTGENVLIGGFIVTGTDPKKVIARGIGPSLTGGGVQGALADPILELHGAGAFATITNDNWRDTQAAEIKATGIAPADDLESAIVATLPANNSGYTAIVRGKDNTTGVGVVEVYDLDTAANSKLANISTRGLVQTGNDILIGGFIAGNGVTRVIIRAIGPSLGEAGVANPLQDPTLELHDGSGTTIVHPNDNWKS